MTAEIDVSDQELARLKGLLEQQQAAARETQARITQIRIERLMLAATWAFGERPKLFEYPNDGFNWRHEARAGGFVEHGYSAEEALKKLLGRIGR